MTVRSNRPSTRSTRGTNTTRPTVNNNDIPKTTLNNKPERRIRASTRGVQKTDEQQSKDVPSRRSRQAGSASPIASVQAAITRTEERLIDWGNDVSGLVDDWLTKNFKPKEPEGPPGRKEVHGRRREIKRHTAPIQFAAAMFFVIVASVFAFGLLSGNFIAQDTEGHPGGTHVEVITEDRGTTSTNTGILRGSGGN